MNPRTYDFTLAAGTACCSAGAYLLAGAGVGLVVLGGLLISLTLTGAALFSRKR